MSTPPIIIVGMHRSGTGLLVRLLEHMGVFMGINQSINSESRFFQEINRRILDSLGCSWRSIENLPETDKLQNSYERLPTMVTNRLKADLIKEHWGKQARLLLINKDVLWGWKDPRNSLLMPVWHKVFPKSIVIHIYRDGRDVALSLLERDIKRNGESIYDQQQKVKRFVNDVKLWGEYIQRIHESISAFDRHYSIQYESLLAKPNEQMQYLIDSLQLPVRIPVDLSSLVDNLKIRRYEKPEFSWARELVEDSKFLVQLGYAK